MMLITVIYVLAIAVLVDALRADLHRRTRSTGKEAAFNASPETIRCFASRLGNGKEHKSLKVDLR
jgi:hypothetical protein